MSAVFNNIQYTLTFLIVLSILVVAHEWGHFIVARLFGIRVDDFSIGFGKRIWRIGRRGDTEYNLRLLPFGGFVKIAGMAADEEPLIRAKDKVIGAKDSDPDAHEVPLMAENVEESSNHPPKPDEFGSKALWQRSLVIFAGPLMSFITGYFIFCLMGILTGVPSGSTLNKVAEAEPGGPGFKAGLRVGDEIVASNGVPIRTGVQMITAIAGNPGKPITLTIKRDGTTFTRTVTPDFLRDKAGKVDLLTQVIQPGVAGSALGLQVGDVIQQISDEALKSGQGAARAKVLMTQAAGKHLTVIVLRDLQSQVLSATLPAAGPDTLPILADRPRGLLQIQPAVAVKHMGLRQSLETGNRLTLSIFSNLAAMIHENTIGQSTGGVIYMYQQTGHAVKSGPPYVLGLMASLSISLAIFNLLPIPILDGGHLLSFFIEWVRRGKKMTDQQQQAFLMTGLAIIGTLFLLIMTKDILRTIHHQLPQ